MACLLTLWRQTIFVTCEILPRPDYFQISNVGGEGKSSTSTRVLSTREIGSCDSILPSV